MDINNSSVLELHRVITGKGSVIKYMKDGTIEILYANGNTCINKRNGVWTSTNNQGKKWCVSIKDGEKTRLDPVPYSPIIDPESGSNI